MSTSVACPSCGFESPPGFRFCGGCGTSLEAPASSVVAVPEEAGPEAERRQLTVMFCDLVGSTTLSGQLEPEEWREILRHYQDLCHRVIARYDGHIAQYLGDGILAYFGYPRAHEDAAQRAIHSGLEIIGELDGLNQILAAQNDLRLQVRLGIDTGEVVTGEVGAGGRTERLALGQTPNIAARLQGLAKPDTVVLSGATHQLAQGFFVCESLGEVRLKGVERSVEAHRAIETSGVRSRFEVTAHRDLAPLVGREEEVRRLKTILEELASGRGRGLLLTGEAGIGKSRLVAVLEDGIEARGFGRLIGRASSHLQSSAFHPMVDLLEKLCGFERHDSPAAKLDKLAQRVDDLDLPENEAMPLFAVLLGLPVGDDYPPLELSPQGRRQRTFELFEELFVGLARKRPLVLIFEDLHWVDPSTVELLGRLLELVREQPILLALAARPEFESPFKDDPHLVVLVLDRLSNEDSRRIVEDLTGGANLPDEILRQILDRTDGVPIFVEELTKMILESDLLQRTEGGYELVGPLPPLAIPPTLSDSLMARLDRLAEAKPIAQQGAVVGREFTYEMLRTAFLVHDLTLHRALRQLVEAELVVERGKAPESRYSFRHSLIHEAAYKSLLKSTRCQYHQRIAHALTAHFSETAERRPELVAYHFTEAGLAESAIGYWQQAGQRALERSAHVEAVSHLGKGLELLARLPESSERNERELPLQATFGSAASAVKGFAAPEVERAYARAHALCQRLPGAPELFWVYWGLWAFHVMRAHFDEALELGERLAEMAVAQGDEGLEMEALFTLGSTRFMRGEHLAAEEALERAIALDHEDRDRSNAFVTGQDVGVTSRSYLALVGWYLGRPDHALALSQEAIAEARRISHPFSLISALASDACLHQYRGEAREAAADAEEALALAEKLGFFWTAQARIPLGWSLATASEPPERRVEGLRQIREGLDAMAASGARLSLPYALTVLADIEWHHGLVDDGLETVERGFETVRQTGEAQSLAELHRLWGELLLASPAKSSAEEAEASFSRAIEIARDQSARSLELRATTSLARLWREEERGEAARERLAAVCDGFTEGFETADLRAATKLLEALGDAVP